MDSKDSESNLASRRDKQLRGTDLEAVMMKRQLGQALNAKEFAIGAGISYSVARSWFHLPGFPVIHGVIFWEDFVCWRKRQNALERTVVPSKDDLANATSSLPPRAIQLLLDS